MKIETAMQKLSDLNGKNLRKFADEYGITIFAKNGGYNKGWPGQVVKRYLGRTINPSKNPDFGNWEVKTTALEFKNGEIKFKYPMSITMINENDVRKYSFKNSSLMRRLKKMIIATTIWEDTYQTETIFHGATIFDLYDNQQIYKQIESDYNLIKSIIINHGFSELHGRIGEYVQPRRKGLGKAFYVRATFLDKFVLPLLHENVKVSGR
ncbi:hypothetical protein C6500_14295 [Candidatus Poribacteria bacterium]|nr:MAG: hypothetical protein C6500_14295 [Candidatus Poribacteria bacterium]